MLTTTLTILLASITLACNDPAHAKKEDSLSSIASAATKEASFGEGVRLATTPVSLKTAIEKNLNQENEIVIEAKIEQVCQSKGCWMVLKDDDAEVRVTFKDYSFFIPKDSAKKTAIVQGKIFSKKLSAAKQRHYLRDAKAPKSELAKVTGPVEQPWIESSGLILK
ncbi:MAG: DUF4920 domain-containing protein [Oligoflexia bacterium]|nr:DUF4920 domain-containing protein [Oligoflexia bacterium]